MIVTVNFDQLVEHDVKGKVEVYADAGRFETFPDDLARYRAGGGRVPILKLHGTSEDWRTVVANVDVTAQGLPEPVAAALLALTDPNDRIPWVYVGYSMRDPDVIAVLQQPAFALGGVELRNRGILGGADA